MERPWYTTGNREIKYIPRVDQGEVYTQIARL